MTDNLDPATKDWHLDKRVPVALIVTILMQTSAGFWWASSINERVAQLEETVDGRQDLAERVTRVEEAWRPIPTQLRRIEDKIDRLYEFERGR